MKSLLLIINILSFMSVKGQDQLPYSVIPDYPEVYNSGTVAARVIDGLGFRYYWATEGLRNEDLQFKPGNDARTSEETLQHIHEMSFNLVNATKKIPSESNKINSNIPFADLRRETLQNFMDASKILKSNGDKGLEDFKLIFKGDNYQVDFPFWNLVNGPISDMLWHVGQVVSFRRSSGNPFDSNVSVLRGSMKQ